MKPKERFMTIIIEDDGDCTRGTKETGYGCPFCPFKMYCQKEWDHATKKDSLVYRLAIAWLLRHKEK